MEFFAKTVNDWKYLRLRTTFRKSSVLGDWQGFIYASAMLYFSTPINLTSYKTKKSAILANNIRIEFILHLFRNFAAIVLCMHILLSWFSRKENFTLLVLVFSPQKVRYPADTDVFKTSLGRLKKVTTSYDQTRRR